MPLNDTKKTTFASQVIELSEHPSYLELVDRVCYYDASNANGVQLDYNEDSLEKAKSLIDMPVVAFYLSDKDGKPSLGGHAVTHTKNGIKFGTSAIGVHTDVWIEDAEVELSSGGTVTKKCLFSSMKIWNRYENMVSAVKRLYDEDRLYNSWEISVSSYKYENNTKKLIDYEFIGNALLGEAIPAYGSASKVLTMASIDDENPCLLIAEALSADLISENSASNTLSNQLENANRKEGLSMDVNENVVVETSEEEVKEDTVETTVENAEAEETAEAENKEEVNNEVAEVSEGDPVEESTTEETNEAESTEDAAEVENTATDDQAEHEVAMNTERDIRRMIRNALNEQRTEDYLDIAFVFPEDKVVLVQSWSMKELEYVQYSYRVEGDKVVLEGEKKVELVISPLQINSEIEKKNSAIADANNRIAELENQNVELNKAKKELDEIKASKAEQEHAEAVKKLHEYVVKSGRFTEEEIASETVQKAINELNESWIKSEIADRLVASLAKGKAVDAAEVSDSKDAGSSLSITLAGESRDVTPDDVLRDFFKRT